MKHEQFCEIKCKSSKKCLERHVLGCSYSTHSMYNYGAANKKNLGKGTT